MKIYISGPITGIPYEQAYAAFERAENIFRDRGFDPVNPMKTVLEQADLTWADYMKQDIPLLLECEAIFMLDGWMRSKGATLERQIAAALGMRVIYESMNVCEGCGVMMADYGCPRCIMEAAVPLDMEKAAMLL